MTTAVQAYAYLRPSALRRGSTGTTLALGIFRLLALDNFQVDTLIFNARFATYLVAIVILGGLVTSTVLNLLVLPTLALRYGRFETLADVDV